MFSAASLFLARLSFKQILLILSYALLESSLLANIGNLGQIQDLLARKEEGWDPHVGEESYPEMIQRDWSDTSRKTRRAWKEIRQYMVQQNLIDAAFTPADLREMLGHLLFQIERLSAQSLNAAQKQRVAPCLPGMPCSEKGILTLICMSVSVITNPGGSVSLRALLADPDRKLIKEMCSKIHDSPLFPDGVSLFKIEDAFQSLAELFLSLYGLPDITDEEPKIDSPGCVKSPPVTTTRHEFCWGGYYEVQTIGVDPPIESQRSRPRRTQKAGPGRDSRGVSPLPKSRKRKPLGIAGDDKDGNRCYTLG